MDRRLLFPAVAITAWAQQASPAAAEAERALRERVTQFFQLQVDKEFRKGEAMVAEDSKDDYYNGSKPDIKGFSIQQVELLDNNTRARVTIKAKRVVKTLVGVLDFEMPAVTSWKLENGQWVWYIDRGMSTQSPFGKIDRPTPGRGATDPPPRGVDLATIMNQVTIDRTSVTLNASNPVQTLTVSNDLQGSLSLEVSSPQLDGISVEIEKVELKSGEKSAIRFRSTSEAKSSGIVRILASPLNKTFEIQVSSN
jgi:hypothetical protein